MEGGVKVEIFYKIFLINIKNKLRYETYRETDR